MSPSITLRNENQSVEAYILEGENLSIFETPGLLKICCLKHEMPARDDFCSLSNFKDLTKYQKLVKNNDSILFREYHFTHSINIHEVNFFNK